MTMQSGQDNVTPFPGPPCGGLNGTMVEKLSRLVVLRQEFKAVDELATEMYRAKNAVEADDPDTEKYVRWEVEKTKRIRALIAARDAYRAAVDAFVDGLDLDALTKNGGEP